MPTTNLRLQLAVLAMVAELVVVAMSAGKRVARGLMLSVVVWRAVQQTVARPVLPVAPTIAARPVLQVVQVTSDSGNNTILQVIEIY